VPASETLILLVVVFFATSVLSVVTGSTSLITVPVMIGLGIEPHVAIATNMLALTFMSVGGSLPFMGNGVVRKKGLAFSIGLTVVGSALGALLVLDIPVTTLRMTIGLAMTAVALFSIMSKDMGAPSGDAPISRVREVAGFALTFVLAVYGGFFSGGYVTMLTAVFVALFGMSFLQAVATTKFVNVFSSGVATLVFLRRGVVDLKLGLILGISMFVGALLGGRIALLLSANWLRRIFVGAVLALAVKMLFVTA
jgi:uncharacterized membrane protein YfcA